MYKYLGVITKSIHYLFNKYLLNTYVLPILLVILTPPPPKV